MFAPELAALDHGQVREWYNGYNWLGAEKVYNPYDVLLLLLRRGRFAAHWFETGTPAFLVDTLFKRRVSSASSDQTVSTEDLLSEFDVGGRCAAEHISTEALLFQTGYLTITGEHQLGGKALYRLGYPNREVRQSLKEHLLRHLVQDADRQMANSMRLARLLEEHDCAGMKELFQAFFASIPYQWYTNNDIANYEGFYASVFYSYFAALGYDITVEDSSSHGRLDMAVRTGGHIYLFEFKVAEMSPPGSALTQLQERDYAAKYRARGEPIHLIGVEFSRQNPQHHHLRHQRRLKSAFYWSRGAEKLVKQAGGKSTRSAADAGGGGSVVGAAKRPDARARKRALGVEGGDRRGVPAWAGQAAADAVPAGSAPDAGRTGGSAGE